MTKYMIPENMVTVMARMSRFPINLRIAALAFPEVLAIVMIIAFFVGH